MILPLDKVGILCISMLMGPVFANSPPNDIDLSKFWEMVTSPVLLLHGLQSDLLTGSFHNLGCANIVQMKSLPKCTLLDQESIPASRLSTSIIVGTLPR